MEEEKTVNNFLEFLKSRNMQYCRNVFRQMQSPFDYTAHLVPKRLEPQRKKYRIVTFVQYILLYIVSFRVI